MKPAKHLLVLGMALCGIVLLSVCSPQVKIVGDKEKPIAINAEIKIHIYQHAASVVDGWQAALDEEGGGAAGSATNAALLADDNNTAPHTLGQSRTRTTTHPTRAYKHPRNHHQHHHQGTETVD